MDKDPRPRPPSLMRHTTYLAGTSSRIALPHIREALVERDLTMPQHAVLAALADFGRLSPREVSLCLRLRPSHVSSYLETLERHRLVTRESHPSDRRSVYVAITAAGRALLDAVAPEEMAADDTFKRALSAEELQTLRRLLAKVVTAADASST